MQVRQALRRVSRRNRRWCKTCSREIPLVVRCRHSGNRSGSAMPEGINEKVFRVIHISAQSFSARRQHARKPVDSDCYRCIWPHLPIVTQSPSSAVILPPTNLAHKDNWSGLSPLAPSLIRRVLVQESPGSAQRIVNGLARAPGAEPPTRSSARRASAGVSPFRAECGRMELSSWRQTASLRLACCSARNFDPAVSSRFNGLSRRSARNPRAEQPRDNMLNLLNAEGWNAASERHLIGAADHARRWISTLEHLRKGYTWHDQEFPRIPEEREP